MALSRKEFLASRHMRPGRMLFVLGVFLISTLPLSAESAGSLFKRGRDAEARQNYEAAFDYYRQAREQKPKEIRYVAAMNRTRFLAAAAKVHRGQLLREMGKLDEALAEFEKAAAIDPSSPVAQQEIRRTREAMQPGKPPAEQPGPPRDSLSKLLDQAQGPVELSPISDQPITLKLTEDTRMIYETIGKLAGINVLFDPDYTSRRIRIELNGVTLEEALQVVAFQSKTFWRPVTPNTIFVAADTNAKRKELEQNVVKTFYLTNLSAATELQDVVNAMRTILEISRIQQLPSQSAIVVRGTPDQVALAEKLIGDIDKAKPEVIIDVAVMQVRRDRARDLGIKPPTGTATIQLQPAQAATTTTTTGGTTTTNTANLTLNTLKNLGSQNYSVAIPAATISLLFSDSTSKIIQNPQIRALDGQKASLKIGDRVPVATGSFQPGVGGLGGINPLVNTQFQYIDVGVNIDITPKVHANRDVTLKLMLDISSVTSRVNIGGIDQPVIGQRKIEHEIRLREGEVNLVGGILEETDVKSLSGWPGVGQIPLLRYLFSSEHKEKGENEIVFVLIPHVVRGQELTALNLKPLDVGTGTSIDLRRSKPQAPQTPPGGGTAGGNLLPNQATATAPPSTAQAPGTVPGQGPGTAVPPQGGAVQGTQAPEGAPPATATQGAQTPSAQSGAGVNLRFDPASLTQPTGRTLALNVVVNSSDPLHTLAMQLQYDPKVLQLLNISNGGYLSRDGQAVAITHREDPGTGKLQVSAIRPPNTPGLSGEGPVLTLTFMTKSKGESNITPLSMAPRDAAGKPLAVSATPAVIRVQ